MDQRGDLIEVIFLLWSPQSYFCKVYKVKDENMKKLDCASFPMVCGPMFLWSGPPGATKKFLPMDQRGDLSEIIFSLWSPL